MAFTRGSQGPSRFLPAFGLVAWLGLLSLTAENLSAQTQGTVTGLVVDRATRQPLAGVQVFIEGTGIGGLSNAGGRYLLASVPAGQVTITAQLIGYATAEQTTTVTADATAALNFELTEQALGLDEIVVTGVAGGTQRRAVGNVVERVDVSARTEVAPATNMLAMLSQQAAGMHTPGVQGMVGTGTSVRIRGVSSMNLGNEPILLVDGVRVDNNASTGPNIRGGRMQSRMNDFDPEDIESIEIIKGPAAATLYGTEAANGVIQIITKKGASGAPVLEFVARQGVNYLSSPGDRFFQTYWYHCPNRPAPAYACQAGEVGVIDSMNVYQDHQDAVDRGEQCPGVVPDRMKGQPCEPIFSNGHQQNYNGNIRGGTDLIRYFVSGGWDNEVGIVDYNWHKSLTTRANVSVTPSASWDMNASMGYVRSETRFAQAQSPYGIWEAVIWAKPDTRDAPHCSGETPPQQCAFRGFRYQTPESAALIDSRSWVNRMTGSFQLNHRPLSWLTQRAILGLDYNSEKNQILFPHLADDIWAPFPKGVFWGNRANGEKELENGHTLFTSFDYGVTVNYGLPMGITASTSAGVQFNARQTERATSFASGFPAPGLTTLSSGASTRASETFTENKSLGTYIQQQLGFREDRLFITAAVRGDDNSAFGAEFDAAIYPKFSATWVMSEEPFFGVDWVDQLRLRTAWGQAGMQPGAFDAVTLYTPQAGPQGQPAMTPRTLGNPGLKPEVGEELELGFDASLFERVSLEYTFYRKITRDAIASNPIRASTGFLGSQMVNLGEVKNWGNEIALRGVVFERGPVGFDLAVSFATHKNEILDLGTILRDFQADDDRVGYPIGSQFSRVLVSADFLPGTNSVNLSSMMCLGGTGEKHLALDGEEYAHDIGGAVVPCSQAPALYRGQGEPTYSGNVNPSLRIGQDLRLSATVEFKGGSDMLRTDNIAGAHRSMVNTPPMNPITDPSIRAYINALDNSVPGLFNPSFARLREVSASYNLPGSWVSSFGASRASLSVGARNLAFIWRKQKYVYGDDRDQPAYIGLAQGTLPGTLIFDPEQQGQGDNTSGIGGATVIPPLSQVLATLRVTF